MQYSSQYSSTVPENRLELCCECVAKQRVLSVQQYGSVYLLWVECVSGGFCRPQLS